MKSPYGEIVHFLGNRVMELQLYLNQKEEQALIEKVLKDTANKITVAVRQNKKISKPL